MSLSPLFRRCLLKLFKLSFNKSHSEPQLQRGAAVIAARKLSSAMSAAKAASDHMKSWFGWVTWLSWKSRGFENKAIFSGAPQRMTGWAWVSSVTAATAQLRESCSGLTVSLVSLNKYFFPASQWLLWMESGQLSRSDKYFLKLECQVEHCGLYFLTRASPCLTLPRGSWPTQERSCVRRGMRQWLFVKHKQQQVPCN